MCDLVPAEVIDLDPDDIDPDPRGLGPPMLQPLPGQFAQPPDLAARDGFGGCARCRAVSGADLTDDDLPGIERDDVDLAVSAPPVAVEDQEAEITKVAAGQIFAEPAQSLPC